MLGDRGHTCNPSAMDVQIGESLGFSGKQALFSEPASKWPVGDPGQTVQWLRALAALLKDWDLVLGILMMVHDPL